MNKDVIYIDVDDDVTAIIGKIKKAQEKIVALVPPKRAGTLQSAVNLRLLERMAKSDKKQLVLITNNQALVALAANAQIPVAKNLQSKPELAEIAAVIVDDGDDIIDGAELPVGDHADTVKVKDGTRPAPEKSRSDAIDTTVLDIDGEEAGIETAAKLSPSERTAARAATAKKASKKSKIPNFDSFRKRLFIGIGAGVALIALLIWMFVFAPAATVIITASTNAQSVSSTVKLGGTAATDFSTGVISSSAQTEQAEETIEVTATGEKDLGQKATGTVRFSTNDADTALGGATIPAGTTLKTGSGLAFTTDEAVVINQSNYKNAQVGVTAVSGGEEYNGASGSLSGSGSSKISAAFVGSAAGGSTNVVKVVSGADLERAMGELIGKSTDDQKKALIKKLSSDYIVIDSSFTVERGDTTSSPAVDQAAPDGKATLTVPTTYSIQAVAKSELDSYLKASLDAKIDKDTQKIYSTGIDTATLSNFQKAEDGTMTAAVTAIGEVGPTIDEADVKDAVKGLNYGNVQSSLEARDGVKEVDVQFSYFWVTKVPNNPDKIKIEFKVDEQ